MNEEPENIDEVREIVEAEIPDNSRPNADAPENDGVNLVANSPMEIDVSINPDRSNSETSGNSQESFTTSNSIESDPPPIPDIADYPNRMQFLVPEFRHRFPGSPEMRGYIDRLNTWNHAAFITNQLYMDAMRRQSQIELNAYVEYLQREEELQREARVEVANMLFVFYISPIWKRAIAEAIDFFILLVIKLIVTFLILDTFNITTNLSKMNISQWVDNPHLAAQISTEVALLEIPFRIIVVIYETYFTLKYAGTPGKRLMGLRVIYVRELHIMDDDVLRNDNDGEQRGPRACVRVFPADVLPFRFALMRSVLKNAFVGLLMSPVCFSFIFVNQNRTGYDVMTNSMVVEFKANTNQPGPIWN